MDEVQAAGWAKEWEGLKERLGACFGRIETRRSAGAFLDGVLSRVERKTSWGLAEAAGFGTPKRLQSLLGRSLWSADEAQKIVRGYALEALGHAEGVLIVDETGFLKQGKASAGVARQYSGTAGRVENSQIGVFLAYASPLGAALVDRRLYLPKAWAEDKERRQKAHVPEGIEFSTKIEMAGAMIEAALDAGAPCRWLLADALYGACFDLRRRLQERGQAYVMAVPSSQSIHFWSEAGPVQTQARAIAAGLPEASWAEAAAGEGSKGLRLYRWARLSIPWTAPEGMAHWLLIRKSLSDPEKTAYYLAFGPADTSLAGLAVAAGQRWAIEDCFARAKTDLGLDHCEARSWEGWHRHMTLILAAAAFLARLGADLRREALKKTTLRPFPPERLSRP